MWKMCPAPTFVLIIISQIKIKEKQYQARDRTDQYLMHNHRAAGNTSCLNSLESKSAGVGMYNMWAELVHHPKAWIWWFGMSFLQQLMPHWCKSCDGRKSLGCPSEEKMSWNHYVYSMARDNGCPSWNRNKGPGASPLSTKYASRDWIAQSGGSPLPMCTKQPLEKGSVFEALIRIRMQEEDVLE